MKAVILAAGISSRMRPLTDHTPKPMLRIVGKPLIEWVVLSLRRGGITNILITTHYLSTVITDYLGDGAQWGVKIRYTYEPDRLDTAGSLLLARDWIGNSPFLICGGHFILPELEVEKFISFHSQKNGIGTICFKPYPDTSLLGAFGQGSLDAESRLVVFKEMPEVTFSNLMARTPYTRHTVSSRAA